MKHLKISMIAVIAIVMGIAASAFNLKNAEVQPKNASYFYLYTSTSTAQGDIQNISNYERNPLNCNTGSHVCGVNLPTDQPTGQPPVSSEFDAAKANLWSSEQAGSATDVSIKMRN